VRASTVNVTDLQEGIALICERTDEREVFGEIIGELEEEERLLRSGEGH